MPALFLALLIVVAIGVGAWLVMTGAVLTTDALVAFEAHDPRAGIAAARNGLGAAWAGLLLFGSGVIGLAQVLL